MSIKGGDRQGRQQPRRQDLPRKTILAMLLSGIALAGWLLIPSGEGWWSPGKEIASEREKLLALVFAGMILGNSFLKNGAPYIIEKEFPTMAIALMAWMAAYCTTIPAATESLGVSGFTLLAPLPLIIAIVRARMPTTKPIKKVASILKQERWPLLFIVIGLALYAGSIIVATSPFGSRLAGSIGSDFAVIGIGALGILGLAVACGVYLGLFGKLLGVAHFVRSLVLKVKRDSG